MHVYFGEETYSHRDQDEFGFPTISQIQTLHVAESTQRALTCHCLLGNGVGSGTLVPVDPHISAFSNENRRQEVYANYCEIVLIPRSPLKGSFEI